METQKKRCCQCDFIVEDNINFCPYCGSNEFENVDKNITMRLRPEDSPWYTPKETDNAQAGQNTKKLNLEEFYEQYVSKKSKGWIVGLIAMSFVSSVTSIVPLFTGNILAVIDIIFYLIIGIIILRRKSWISALIATIYSGVLCLLNMIVYQDGAGMLYFIIAIVAVRKLRKFQKEYKEYKLIGKIPEMEI